VAGCPFEYGHEDPALPEILALPRDQTAGSGPNWQVRVVPDRVPALRVEGEVWREGVGMYDRLAGVGAHEVIVESPHHGRQTADLEIAELATVLAACRARLVDLRRDQRLRYTTVFKNKGRPAGATLTHPHWQLLATPVIPPVVARELKAGRDHFRSKERCLFCDLIGDEQRLGERVPLETARFVAITPFAATHPFETWILPKVHGHDFGATEDDDLRGLAIILRDLLRRLRVLLRDPPYNIVLHTAPSPHPRPALPDYWSTIERDYHWHLEVRPRITRPAGFEWATGLAINPTPPEEAARYLREADPEGWTEG
jgi:UDPglucose--hexose-1-phosphate uridylyltransferase